MERVLAVIGLVVIGGAIYYFGFSSGEEREEAARLANEAAAKTQTGLKTAKHEASKGIARAQEVADTVGTRVGDRVAGTPDPAPPARTTQPAATDPIPTAPKTPEAQPIRWALVASFPIGEKTNELRIQKLLDAKGVPVRFERAAQITVKVPTQHESAVIELLRAEVAASRLHDLKVIDGTK